MSGDVDLYEFIGNKIRDLRLNYGGKGLSQEELAEAMDTTANTVSRWETATYKISTKALDRLARFFRVNIAVFFPHMESPRLQALMSAMGDLRDEDIDELTRYAQFRKARQMLDSAKQQKRRRKTR